MYSTMWSSARTFQNSNWRTIVLETANKGISLYSFNIDLHVFQRKQKPFHILQTVMRGSNAALGAHLFSDVDHFGILGQSALRTFPGSLYNFSEQSLRSNMTLCALQGKSLSPPQSTSFESKSSVSPKDFTKFIIVWFPLLHFTTPLVLSQMNPEFDNISLHSTKSTLTLQLYRQSL